MPRQDHRQYPRHGSPDRHHDRRREPAHHRSPAGHGAQGGHHGGRSPEHFEPRRQHPPPRSPDRREHERRQQPGPRSPAGRDHRREPRRHSPDRFEPDRRPQPPPAPRKPERIEGGPISPPPRRPPDRVKADRRQPQPKPRSPPPPPPSKPQPSPRPPSLAPRPAPSEQHLPRSVLPVQSKQSLAPRAVPTQRPPPSPSARPPSPSKRRPSPSARPPPPVSAKPGPRSPEACPLPKRGKAAPSARVDGPSAVTPSFQSPSGYGGTSRQQSMGASGFTGQTFQDSRTETTRPKFFVLVKQNPRKSILVVAVVCLVIIAGILAGVLAAVLKQGKPQKPLPVTQKGRLFFDVCSKQPEAKKAATVEKCVVGIAPNNDSCRASGFCKAFAFTFGQKDKKMEFVDGSLVYPTSIGDTSEAFCRVVDRGQDRLGVCSKNRTCDHVYNGTDDPTWYQSGVWADNCDQPNPCWRGKNTELFNSSQGTIERTREKCRMVERVGTYMPGMDAVVWLMHTRCKVGKNRTTARPCEGLPIKLWKCLDIGKLYSRKPLKNEVCEQNPQGFKRDQCLFSCSGGVPDAHMPNGARCSLAGVTLTEGQETFCFNGMCLIAYPNDGSIMPIGDCLSVRKAEEGW